MPLFIPELIRRKRDDGRLTPSEIAELIAGYTAGEVPDYQMSSMLMAVLFRGLDAAELGAWTEAMLGSGEVLEHPGVAARKVDKHSTGGVGDKISLCLAPAVASLGVPIPMISGRGLGHTGGTLDKLESIPGFRVGLDTKQMRGQLERLGLILVGQTAALVPADRKLYALRDVTGTVESIPLIASSIMSKKLAEGIDGLVLDVKVGVGAFMPDIERAEELARTLIGIGEGAGVDVRALITRMDRPIGRTVGNALETAEALDVLRGEGPADTVELTVELGAEMLVLGAAVADVAAGRIAMARVLNDGSALALFAQVIEAQGGDPGVCDDPSGLPRSKQREQITAAESGYVVAVHPRRVAQAAIELGAGRRVVEDQIDPATGVVLAARVGDRVEAGAPLAELHHNGAGIEEARRQIGAAFQLGDDPPAEAPLVIERL